MKFLGKHSEKLKIDLHLFLQKCFDSPTQKQTCSPCFQDETFLHSFLDDEKRKR